MYHFICRIVSEQKACTSQSFSRRGKIRSVTSPLSTYKLMMTSTRIPWRTYPVASRTRAEAYAGLFLLVTGLTVLTLGGCPHSNNAQRPRRLGVSLRTSGTKTPALVEYGNALDDGIARKGWWVGHFMPTGSPRYSSQVETKWVNHGKGKRHESFSTNKVATSMAILISGKHRIEFENSYVVLEHPGDYVIWGPGVAHSWFAIEASTMLCIRWPSISGDQVHSFVNSSSPHAITPALNEGRTDENRLLGRNSASTLTGLNGTLPLKRTLDKDVSTNRKP